MTTRAAQTARIKHWMTLTRAEAFGITRYFAACGYNGITQRDFSANITRDGKRVVTCPICLGRIKITKGK